MVIADLAPPVDLEKHTNITFFKTDVSCWKDQLALFKQAITKNGRLDIVFANAGIAEGEMAFEDRVDPTTGDPIEPTWSTINVNLKGMMITVKLALHHMRKSPLGGTILLTGSRASKF